MEEAKWYVVHTFSGYENKVKVDIEKTVENRNLQDQILEVAIPLQEGEQGWSEEVLYEENLPSICVGSYDYE
mgnify:CR=1 FL=1